MGLESSSRSIFTFHCIYCSLKAVPLLTPELEEEQKQKQTEKRKKKKKAQQERLKQQNIQDKIQSEKEQAEKGKLEITRKLQAVETLHTKKLEALTLREKLALAAESRFAKKQCSCCGNILTGVPFERLQYLYCSINCVQQHMSSGTI